MCSVILSDQYASCVHPTDHINLYRSCAGQTWTLLERHTIANATCIQVPFPKHNFTFPIHSFFRAAFPNSEEAPSNQTLEPVSLKWGRVDDTAIIDYLSNTPLVGHAGDKSVPAGPIPVGDLAVVGARYMIHPRGVFDHPKGRSCYVLGRGTQSDRPYTASAARGIHDYEISKFCQILMREGMSVNTDRGVRPKHSLATRICTDGAQDCNTNSAEGG